MNLFVAPSLKRQSASETYALWPRPCAHTQLDHRDSSLRLSCNLGRCVTSSFCGSLFSAGVLRDPNAFRPFSRVDCCVQPDIKLGMIVLRHSDWVSQRMWSTIPCRPRVGLVCTPRPCQKIPYVVDCAAYRLLSKRDALFRSNKTVRSK